VFSEFNRISETHRLNLSEGIRDMGIRFPISSSVISDWTNQSSHSLPLSLFRHPNHPPKMHYRISQWLRFFDAWMLETRRAIVVRRDESHERRRTQESSQRARSLLQHGIILHSFAILFPLLFSFRLLSLFEPLITPTNYSQRSISTAWIKLE